MIVRVTYSPGARAAYVYLRDRPVARTEPLTDGVVIDYAEDGEPVGIEILDANTVLGGTPTGVEFELLTEELSVAKGKA